jgi:hypothetical protein
VKAAASTSHQNALHQYGITQLNVGPALAACVGVIMTLSRRFGGEQISARLDICRFDSAAVSASGAKQTALPQQYCGVPNEIKLAWIPWIFGQP